MRKTLGYHLWFIFKANVQFVFAVSESIQLPQLSFLLSLFITKQLKKLKFVEPPSKYDVLKSKSFFFFLYVHITLNRSGTPVGAYFFPPFFHPLIFLRLFMFSIR